MFTRFYDKTASEVKQSESEQSKRIAKYNAAFGWWPFFDAVVASGRFNRSDMTPIEAARSADFYAALKWYAMNQLRPE